MPHPGFAYPGGRGSRVSARICRSPYGSPVGPKHHLGCSQSQGVHSAEWARSRFREMSRKSAGPPGIPETNRVSKIHSNLGHTSRAQDPRLGLGYQ